MYLKKNNGFYFIPHYVVYIILKKLSLYKLCNLFSYGQIHLKMLMNF